jgi:hypothetical protein
MQRPIGGGGRRDRNSGGNGKDGKDDRSDRDSSSDSKDNSSDSKDDGSDSKDGGDGRSNDNLNTTQILEYTKDRYNAKIRNERVSPKVPPTTYIGRRMN